LSYESNIGQAPILGTTRKMTALVLRLAPVKWAGAAYQADVALQVDEGNSRAAIEIDNVIGRQQSGAVDGRDHPEVA
jgi:hypothetical protein